MAVDAYIVPAIIIPLNFPPEIIADDAFIDPDKLPLLMVTPSIVAPVDGIVPVRVGELSIGEIIVAPDAVIDPVKTNVLKVPPEIVAVLVIFPANVTPVYVPPVRIPLRVPDVMLTGCWRLMACPRVSIEIYVLSLSAIINEDAFDVIICILDVVVNTILPVELSVVD